VVFLATGWFSLRSGGYYQLSWGLVGSNIKRTYVLEDHLFQLGGNSMMPRSTVLETLDVGVVRRSDLDEGASL
jgi:hypothetical protein